jgi:hypothetical protein
MRIRIAAFQFLLILAACAAPGVVATTSPAEPSPSVEASTAAETDLPASGNELTGFLGADSIEGGCTYLETEDGTRYEVIYPQGYEIDRSSATLRDPSGEVIASAGDVVTVRGHEASDMVSICQIGPIFQATEVISVE